MVKDLPQAQRRAVADEYQKLMTFSNETMELCSVVEKSEKSKSENVKAETTRAASEIRNMILKESAEHADLVKDLVDDIQVKGMAFQMFEESLRETMEKLKVPTKEKDAVTIDEDPAGKTGYSDMFADVRGSALPGTLAPFCPGPRRLGLGYHILPLVRRRATSWTASSIRRPRGRRQATRRCTSSTFRSRPS